MSTHTALVVGVLIGVLVMMTVGMSVAIRFVSSDVEGFRKWLDRSDV
jgi:5-bromo-4-chloroindolyl phosphate hydrolysis protein